MTTFYYGINHGQTAYEATVGTSNPGSDVVLEVVGGNVPARIDLDVAIKQLLEFIQTQEYTPF